MNLLIKIRSSKGLSQRRLASLAGTSYKTIQLIESGRHDPKLSTLQDISQALGYPHEVVRRRLDSIFSQPTASIEMTSERVVEEGEASWKIWLFEFVDVARSHQDPRYFQNPPVSKTPLKIKSLFASTVETLCVELKKTAPLWCREIPPLKDPWFVSEIEGLKASALIESPVHFRKRNIFVLRNFLERR